MTETDSDSRSAQKARTRERLIEATQVVIGREGLSGTTVAKVACEAGVSQGMVSFHFEGKDRLLEEVLTKLVGQYRQDCSRALETAPDNPASQLQALVTALLRHAENPVHLASWFAFWGEATARALYKTIGTPVDRATHQRLVELGQQLFPHHRDGELPIQMADGLMALVNGYWVSKLMRPDEVELESGERVCMNYIDLLRAEIGPWPADFERWLPAESWACQPIGELARKYDTVETHGWYSNLLPTVERLGEMLEPGALWLDYSGGTGILIDRVLRDHPELAFGALLVDASPKFLRLALEKLSADRRTAFRWIRYLDDEKRLQRLEEVLSTGLLERGVDILTSTNAIHLYYDMDETLASWRKVLRPGGLALVQSGNIDNPEAAEGSWIIDLTVERLQPVAQKLVREHDRYLRFRKVLDDAATMAKHDRLRQKFFLPVRPLSFYLEQLERAGFEIVETKAVSIEAHVAEWTDFLAAYHEGVLGWAGGSKRIEGTVPDEETVLQRKQLLSESLEQLFEGQPTFDANWTYITCRA